MLDFKYRPRFGFSVLPQWPPAYVIPSTIDDDDDFRCWGTLTYEGNKTFEFTRKSLPDLKTTISFPDEPDAVIRDFCKFIWRGYAFELRITREATHIAAYHPRARLLIDEAEALARKLGELWIEAKYQDGRGDPERLKRAWRAALRRLARRYRGE